MDASPEEQRRVREIIQMFSTSETQDELGGRQVVVVLSDALFPGTSVLHTRARYLFFIPWFFRAAASRSNPVKSLEALERGMIGAFRSNLDQTSADTLEGLVGRAAGEAVKQLPSTAYWTALSEWGILRHPGTIREVLAATSRGPGLIEADELAERQQAVWHPDIGATPEGFPATNLHGGFTLTAAEASFLRDRWVSLPGESMLAHLARTPAPLSGATTPWDEPLCWETSDELRRVLRFAQRFSLAQEGAQLLYADMLTEQFIKCEYEGAGVDRARSREAFNEWTLKVRSNSQLFAEASNAEFWEFVRSKNPRVGSATMAFFNSWFDIAAGSPDESLVENKELQTQVRSREIFVKKPAQSRLGNPKMLAGWRGTASAPTVYRWGQVRRLVGDVHAGLGVVNVRS